MSMSNDFLNFPNSNQDYGCWIFIGFDFRVMSHKYVTRAAKSGSAKGGGKEGVYPSLPKPPAEPPRRRAKKKARPFQKVVFNGMFHGFLGLWDINRG